MDESNVAADGSLAVEHDESGYASLVACTTFPKGAVVSDFGAREVCDRPNYLTVQVGADLHIMLSPQYLQYINHSCDPNAYFDTKNSQILALRAIGVGESITFFYPSTEWVMDRPFACHCGAPTCLGEIAGASQIDRDVLMGYRLAEHISSAFSDMAKAGNVSTPKV